MSVLQVQDPRLKILLCCASQVQDKVGFMINNLTRDTLEAKAEELKKALKPEMWPWFCNYMVIRRVAQEANHQNLYLQVTVLPVS